MLELTSSTDSYPGRPTLGGRLSRHLGEQLAGRRANVHDVARLACNFWLNPQTVPDITDEPTAVVAEIDRFVHGDAGSSAAYQVEHRRARAACDRAVAALRIERAAFVADPVSARAALHRDGQALGPSAFQRVTLAQARRVRIEAAAANLWRKLERRRHHQPAAAPRQPTAARRPRARRSHRVVRAAKVSGDSGDSDGEPPRSRAVEPGATGSIANAGVP